MTFPTRFILLCHVRTGSTLLGSLLASHPAIAWGGEEFNHYGAQRGLGRLTRLVARQAPWLRLSWLAGRHRGLIYGCKFAPGYVRTIHPAVARVHRQGWLILHLERRNLFLQAVSSLVAQETGRSQRFIGQTPSGPTAPELTIDPQHLLRRMKVRFKSTVDEQSAVAGLPHVKVCYEEDLEDSTRWQATAGRVFAALGLDPVPIQATVKKTWERPYSAIITNYAELVETARAAGYGHFLE